MLLTRECEQNSYAVCSSATREDEWMSIPLPFPLTNGEARGEGKTVVIMNACGSQHLALLSRCHGQATPRTQGCPVFCFVSPRLVSLLCSKKHADGLISAQPATTLGRWGEPRLGPRNLCSPLRTMCVSTGAFRGVCKKIDHFPEDADYEQDTAEYLLRKFRASRASRDRDGDRRVPEAATPSPGKDCMQRSLGGLATTWSRPSGSDTEVSFLSVN